MANDGEIGPIRTERRDAAENRQRILDAAARLFATHGVENVSMNQIATDAQIGPGTLYRRYRNKGEVCLDLIRGHIDVLFADIDAFLTRNQGEAPGLRLREMIRLFLRFRETKVQLLRGVEEAGSARNSTSPPQGVIYNRLHRIMVDLFDEMDAVAQAPRAARDAMPTSVFRADLLLNSLKNDFYLVQRDLRGYSNEILLDQLCSVFIL